MLAVLRNRFSLGQARAAWGSRRGGKAISEQRSSERASTYKAARIGTGVRATVHCGVRNLSVSGACLRVDDPAEVPATFHLVFDSGEPSRMCRVVWRNARQIGVRFE